MKKTVILSILVIMVLAVFLCAAFVYKKKADADEAARNHVPDETVLEISPEDADALVEEKLADTPYTKDGRRMETISGNSVYLYDVLEDELPVGEVLAVDAVSGEVYVYRDGSLLPYSDFSGYDAGMDESIEWTGIYEKEEMTLVMEETEPGSFTFCFRKADGTESEPGFGFYEDRVKGRSDFGGKGLEFRMNGDKLDVRCDEESEYAGEYLRQ